MIYKVHINEIKKSLEQIEDMHLLYEHNMVCAIRSVWEDKLGVSGRK